MTWTDDTREAGRQWEEDFAKLIGGKLQPGSGNTKWAKLDVMGNNILWWLRHTAERHFVLSQFDVDEAIVGARGLGGPGVVPGMGIRIGNKDVVVLLATDLIDILERPSSFAISERKSEARRRRAAVPALLREDPNRTPSDGRGDSELHITARNSERGTAS